VSSNLYTPRARTLAGVALCVGLILPLTTPVAPATANGCAEAPTEYDASGKGGPGEPAIAIASVGHLLHLAVTPADWGKSFVQTAAIDLTGCTWTPIGNSTDTYFTGAYDGADLAITGLSVDLAQQRVGMFGAVGSSGSLSRIRLVGVAVAGEGRAAGLAGENRGTITDSSVSGTVRTTDANRAGGLVGENTERGTITRSSSSATVSSTTSGTLGGLVGENNGTITRSSATGAVTGTSRVGGLVGENNGTITRSSATGAVTGTSRVGGLVGTSDGDEDEGDIIESFATGAVTGISVVGGLVGLLIYARIESSYATGHVNATTVEDEWTFGAGGLVGQAEGEASIADSYATGDVTSPGWRVGGLAGFSNGDVIRSYALGTVVGGVDADGVARTGRLVGEYTGSMYEVGDATALGDGDLPLVGVLGSVDDTFSTVRNSVLRTSAELKAIATFRDILGWDIVAGWEEFAPSADPAKVWGICEGENDGYPFLLWQFSEEDDACGDGDGDGEGGGSGAAGASGPTPVLTGGNLPTIPPGQGTWQRSDGTNSPLTPSAPGARQVRYTADGLTVTLTGGSGTNASDGLVTDRDGNIECEVCATLAAGGVVDVWLFSTPRLVAAHRIEDLPCQRFTIPLGAALDGLGPVAPGPHTLQFALPTAAGMQSVNIGITVTGAVPTRVPAGEGPSGALWWLAAALAGAALMRRGARGLRTQ
jgi:hypothetical protein